MRKYLIPAGFALLIAGSTLAATQYILPARAHGCNEQYRLDGETPVRPGDRTIYCQKLGNAVICN